MARFWVAFVIAVLAIPPVIAHPIGDGVDDLPIFDTHIHYYQDAWEAYPPETVIELMDKNGVAMALVSSTPDEGTIKLFEYAPARIIPEVMPYYDSYGQWNWVGVDGILNYIRARLDKHPHMGIGELHVHSIDDKDIPFLKKVAHLAAERDVLIHVHGDERSVDIFYEAEPNVTILWAHAGMFPGPDIIADRLSKHPTLWAELSFREHEIISGDVIDPAWRELLMKYADRFMIGSDTFINDQWEVYGKLIEKNRNWLRHFPRDIAEKIAYGNAERLFKRKVSKDLIGTR